MKTIRQAIIGAVALLFASAIPVFAIENLYLSVQSSNVVLSWPSTSNETYIVQYLPTLDGGSSWLTLTDYFAATPGTNLTFFVHSNTVQYPSASDGGTNDGIPTLPMVKSDGGSGVHANDASDGTTNTYNGFYRVVRDGVHIFGLTNGAVLSGTTQFPIEFALSSTDEIVGVVFYDENNSPIIGASAQGAGNYWTLTWDTPISFNGSYNVYAEIDFAGDDPAVSVPVTVTVSNVISFPNYFSQNFGSQMWIYAETIPNASYELDIYDENTNYLGSFDDYADSGGYISFLWDLTDGSGQMVASTNLFGVFTVDTSSLSSVSQEMITKNIHSSSPNFQTAAAKKNLGSRVRGNGASPKTSSSASAKTVWAKEPSWSPGNSWAIAYSPLIVSGSPTTLDIQEMMVGGDGGEYGGMVSTLGYYGLGAPMSPVNVSQTSAFEMADTNTRAQFLTYMAQSQYRHLYFFGHGSSSSFGTPGAVINSRDVQNDLGNYMHTAKPILYHPYRFVFIDGCSAGSGNLCESFGIPEVTVNTNYFATLGIESRAFLGFKTTTSFNPNQWTWRALMLGGFLDDWMGNKLLQDCVANAKAGVHSSGFQSMDSSAVIYGAIDLKKDVHTP